MRALVLLVLAALVTAGCTGNGPTLPDTESEPAPEPEPQDDVAKPTTYGSTRVTVLTPARNATPGQDVSFLVRIDHDGAPIEGLIIRLHGGEIDGGLVLAAVVNGSSARFLTLHVPENTTEDVSLSLTVAREGDLGRTTSRAGRIHILPEGAVGFGPGQDAQVIYTGWLTETGEVFNTNDPLVAGQPTPQTESYVASPGSLSVTSQPRNVVLGFHDGMLGMQVNESRTISMPAELAYGPEWVEERTPREERVPRNESIPTPEETVDRSVFDDHVTRTGQGQPADYGPNATFVFVSGQNTWPYRISAWNETTVKYRLDVTLGMNFTFHVAWPNGTQVVSMNATHATFRTTPTTAIGEPVTLLPHWPNMTAVALVLSDEIVVRHDPPAGHEYTLRNSYGSETQARVLSVEEDAIVIETRSAHPLAGKALTFDIRVEALA